VSALSVELRRAGAVGLVGGSVLGMREALVTLEANAFVQPTQYLAAYVAVPILGGMLLGTLLLVPVALAVALRARPSGGVRSLPVYAAVLGTAAAFSMTAPRAAEVIMRLRAVGADVGAAAFVPWVLALLLPLAAGVALGAAAAWWGERAAAPLAAAARIVAVLGLVLLWPVARFVATDWKWSVPARGEPPAPGMPNIVLISIDTLRADHVDPTLTPNVARLGAEGVVFRHAITSAPWTLPAVASLHTALSPRRHGAGAITNRRDPLGRAALSPDAWTLANALEAQGYRTEAIVTNPYLALHYGLGRGFDRYENLTIESEFFLAARETTPVRLLAWLAPRLIVGDRAERVSARAVRAVAAGEPDRPFFLWLHYVDPHPPYENDATAEHKSFRGDSLFGARLLSDATLASPDPARLRSGELRPGPAEKAAIRALYAAEVARVDAAIGTVLETLDRRGLRERTLVVAVADHGEEFWDHGGVEHGHSVYDEVVRVPLIARWPGHLPAGTVVDALVRMVDVAPTVLDLLGLPPPPGADGSSVLPLVTGVEPDARVATTENMLFAEERLGVRTRTRKYVSWENGKEEVYDLVRDPAERVDLAGVARERRRGRRLIAHVPPSSTEASAPPATHAAALHALGYVW
jgi:arylsulfatase A-like enzyme